MRNKIEIEDKEEEKIGGELDGTLSQFIRAGPRKLFRQTSLWATLHIVHAPTACRGHSN